MTRNRIRSFVETYGTDGVYLSVSGGKDFCVLLDMQLHYDTAKNGAGKVQIYLRFISPFFFLDGDGNLQFF